MLYKLILLALAQDSLSDPTVCSAYVLKRDDPCACSRVSASASASAFFRPYSCHLSPRSQFCQAATIKGWFGSFHGASAQVYHALATDLVVFRFRVQYQLSEWNEAGDRVISYASDDTSLHAAVLSSSTELRPSILAHGTNTDPLIQTTAERCRITKAIFESIRSQNEYVHHRPSM